MGEIFLCLVLASCQNVDVVNIRDGHFTYRGLAQFFGKVRVVK